MIAPRVAAVQSERRPGRPPLNGMKNKLYTRRPSLEVLGSYWEPSSHSLPVNNNLPFVGTFDTDVVENGDAEMSERSLVLESLNCLKQSLVEEKIDDNMLGFLDPQMFDNLPLSVIHFHLPTPLPSPSHLNSQFVCESASRILFGSVYWARKTGSVFKSLPHSIQVFLMRSSWSDLFILCLAQCREQLSLPAIMTAMASTLQNCLGHDRRALARTKQLAATLTRIREVLNRFDELQLEPEEFAYLKLCCLFGPGKRY